VCYYTDFRVVRIRDGNVTGWHNDIKGARALVAAGSRVALFGGYGPDHDRLALTELSTDRSQPISEYRIVLPDERPLPPDTLVVGRGSRLHFLNVETPGYRQFRAGQNARLNLERPGFLQDACLH